MHDRQIGEIIATTAAIVVGVTLLIRRARRAAPKVVLDTVPTCARGTLCRAKNTVPTSLPAELFAVQKVLASLEAASMPSPVDVRRLHSRVRCALLGLDVADAADAARFPISVDSELRVQRAVLNATSDCGEDVWYHGLRRAAEQVLAFVDANSPGSSPMQLAVVLHRAAQQSSHESSTAPGEAAPEGNGCFMSPLIEVRETEGERGLYAREALPPGTVILAERPYHLEHADDFEGLVAAHVIGGGLLAPHEGARHGAPHEGLHMQPGRLASAPCASADAAARWLRNVQGLGEIVARQAYFTATNNGYMVSVKGQGTPHGEGEDALLLYAKKSLFNHSCWPNCESTDQWASSEPTRLFTTREVAKGSELTLTYSPDWCVLPTQIRRSFLASSFGFTCACNRCSADDDVTVDELLEAGLSECQPAAKQGAFRAHARLFAVRRSETSGQPEGFCPKEHSSWEDVDAGTTALLSALHHFGCAPTHWLAHMTRELRCRALEALAAEARAEEAHAISLLGDNRGDQVPRRSLKRERLRERLLAKEADETALHALGHHAAALLRLVPAHSGPIVCLARRAEAVRDRLDDRLLSSVKSVEEPVAANARANATSARSPAGILCGSAESKALDALQQQHARVMSWVL